MPAPHPVPAPSRFRTARRWAARTAAGVAALVAVAAAGVYARSEYRLRATFDVPEHAPLRLAADSVTLARGRRVADVRGCTDCHGARLEGRVLMDNPLVGRLAPPNLTAGRGGRGGELVPADWERAVRHGVRRDGRSLFVMPAQDYNGLSDEDLAALVSYARTVPSVDNAPPTSRLGPLGRVLFVAGKLPAAPAEIVGHARPHPTAVVAAATPQYGAYLAATCAGCHNERFTGGAHAGGPARERCRREHHRRPGRRDRPVDRGAVRHRAAHRPAPRRDGDRHHADADRDDAADERDRAAGALPLPADGPAGGGGRALAPPA
jgi:mono/diheme cytochrome c family protein